MFNDSRKAEGNNLAHHRARLILLAENEDALRSPRAPLLAQIDGFWTLRRSRQRLPGPANSQSQARGGVATADQLSIETTDGCDITATELGSC